jgi:foldase protein PrsA
MKQRLHALMVLCAILVPAAIVVGCGVVPGNAVAEVDGTTVEKQDFDHWMTIAAKSSGAAVPKPPDYAACVAAARKNLPKPGKGVPKTTDAQLKTQCKQQYEQLRDQVLNLLISFEWIEGEAQAQGVKVTDAEARKTFDQQRKQSFPKDADYQKFLKDSGQTEGDILKRVRLDALSNKIRDKVIKGKDKVSEQQIKTYYDKNKATFGRPEQRDLRVVLTKARAKAAQARAELVGGAAWAAVAKKYSIDDASKSQGGKLPAVAKGQQEKAFDDAIFNAKKGATTGPIKTQFGYYVLEVSKVTEGKQQSLEQSKDSIKQILTSDNQRKALDKFGKDYRKRWKAETACRKGYTTADCKNGPKTQSTATSTPQQQQAPATTTGTGTTTQP